MTTLYCDISDVKGAGRLAITTGNYDTDISAMIAGASALIDKYCNVPDGGFCVTADTTHYYDVHNLRNGTHLVLDMPCLSVTSLTDASGRTFPTNAYRLHPRNYNPKREIHLLSNYAWSWIQDGEIIVVGKFGYSTQTPDPIIEATATYAAWMFKRWQAALQDATANQDLGQIIYGSEMPKQVKAMLSLYTDYTKIL